VRQAAGKLMLQAMQAQKIERDVVREKCALLNVSFSEKYRIRNAEWEAQSVRGLKMLEVMSGAMGGNGGRTDFSFNGNMGQVIGALSDKSLPTTLPPPENKSAMVDNAEIKINREMQGLSEAQQYAYCEKGLEKPNENSSERKSNAVQQGM
jgi:hypothetical protein